MLDAALNLVLELTGAAAGAVLRVASEADGAGEGVPAALATALRRPPQAAVPASTSAWAPVPPLPQMLLQPVLRDGQVLLADAPFDPVALPGQAVAGYGPHAAGSVGLWPLPDAEGRAVAVLYVEHAQPLQGWAQPPRGPVLQALVAQLASALRQMRCVEALEQQVLVLHDEVNARDQRLQAALEAADMLARARSTFLAEMGHDIRTPMNAILGLSYLALRATADPRQLDYLRKIQQSGRQLLGIINDVLDLSRLQAGELGVERIDFALDSLLENIVNLVGDAVADKGLELVFDVDPGVPSALLGDPLRLGQILINLIDGALRRTDHGEIVVRVRVLERTEAEVLLQFTVQDSGTGLAPEPLARLQQALREPVLQEPQDGSAGLGLTIATGLARLMGGEIGVHSSPGQGSSFWIRSRLGVAQQRRPVLALRAGLRGRRVLVVDDNAHARQVLREMLAGMALAPVDVASGDAALEEIRRAAQQDVPYEIVYLDWKMPGMDGPETARRIQAMAQPGLRGIVMVTSYGQQELGARVRAMGISEIVTKPVSPSSLFEATLRLLGAGPAEEPAPAAPGAPQEGALQGLRVLLVEDNELNQQIALELLRGVGCEVGLAVHGREAVAQVQQGPYDMVLMDVQMPVMDGVEAARAIHALPGLETLPIIAMTATFTQAERERCRQAGMVDFVAKPVEPEQLWRALQRWAPGTHAEPDSARAPMVEERLPTLLAPLEVPLPVVDGLNQAAGLRRAMGRQDLYLSLLRRFVDQHRHAARDIAVALGARDLDAAERLAHTLKRFATDIGAEALLPPLQALERGIVQRARPADAEALLDALALPLGRLVAGISKALAAAEDTQGLSTGTPPERAGQEPAPGSREPGVYSEGP